ncbi:MAG: hypothetical protein H7144_07130 [Burkholderiales bacterium]|nr:hypothetical protein [Phycisphaerae bacterium]
MLETIVNFAHQFMMLHAPGLVLNPLPLFLVAGYFLTNVALYFLTKGKEFAIVGYTGLVFLIPFVR